MNETVDTASVVIAVLYVLSGLLFSRVGVPQTHLWIRYGYGFDGLQAFRLKTGLVCSSFALFLFWRSVVYFDYALFDQHMMGVLGARWPIELTISILVLLAALYTAGLYILVQSRSDPRRTKRELDITVPKE